MLYNARMIELDQVSFAYSPTKPIVRNVSLVCEAGTGGGSDGTFRAVAKPHCCVWRPGLLRPDSGAS